MNFDDMHSAVREAQRTIEMADSQVGRMAYLIRGRLRAAGVSNETLRRLKRELADYNMHTGKWKERE